MSNGKGCKCGAYGSYECGCEDVDWTPQEIYDLREENASLKRRCEELERALRIESNEPEERSQEANHYNWLEDQNEKLKALAEKMAEVLEWIERFYQMECNDSVSNQLVEVRNRAKSALAAYRKEMEGK
jgi:predicted RNase H-like nuclease (RuvC/YqgF family)